MKKLLAIVLALSLITTVFAGCKKVEETNGQEVSQQTSQEKLIVATNAEFPPFEQMNATTQEPEGFDIDLINEVAKRLNMTVTIKNMDFESVVGAVQSKSCNVAISGLTINETRKKSVDFSDPYYSAAQIVIVRNDDNSINGTTKAEIDEQLKNKKIGVCSGFTGGNYVEGDAELEYPGIEGAETKIYDNISLAIQDLKNKSIEAIVMDNTVAINACKTDENKDSVKAINVGLTEEEYGIAYPKGDTELGEKINKALKDMEADGTMNTLRAKWFN